MALRKNPRFDLKLKYRRTMEVSFIAAICMILLAFRYSPQLTKAEFVQDRQELIKGVDLPPVILPPVPPPPPKPLQPVASVDAPEDPKYVPPDEFDTKKDAPPLPDLPKPEVNVPEETPIFLFVEQMPEMIGGIQSLYGKLVYPEFAIRAGIQGKVLLEAVVDERGNTTDIIIRKGIGGGCDEAAINALSDVKFSPGKQRGKPVKVRITVPIQFTLTN